MMTKSIKTMIMINCILLGTLIINIWFSIQSEPEIYTISTVSGNYETGNRLPNNTGNKMTKTEQRLIASENRLVATTNRGISKDDKPIQQRYNEPKEPSKKQEQSLVRMIILDKKLSDKQYLVDYALKKGGKDFVLTLTAENGSYNHNLRSYIKGKNGFYDYGLCQINKGYHRKIVDNPKFIDPIWQLDRCYELYKGGTKFYGYNVRNRYKYNFIYEYK